MLEVQAFVGNDLWPWFCSNVSRSSDSWCVSSTAFIFLVFALQTPFHTWHLATQGPPSYSQGAPKELPRVPKSSQDRPSYALVIRNSAPRFPRRTQGGLKEHQRVPDELPRAPNELPRTSQQHPRAPKELQGVPKNPHGAFKSS